MCVRAMDSQLRGRAVGFDRPQADNDNQFRMPTFLRRNTHLVRWALLVAFSLGLSANCLATTQMSEAEMACCATMAAGCGGAMGQEHSCCRTESPRIDQQLAAGPRLVAPPAPELIAFGALDLNVDAMCPRAFQNQPETSPPIAAQPSYLIFSVFRI